MLHLNTAPGKRASRYSHTLTFQPTNSVERKSLTFSSVTSLNSLIDGQISGTQNTGGGVNTGVEREGFNGWSERDIIIIFVSVTHLHC